MMLIGDSWHLSYNPNQKLLRQVDPQKVNPRYVTWETKSPHRNTSETNCSPIFEVISSEDTGIFSHSFRSRIIMNHRNMVLPQHEHGSNIIKHHEISKHRAMGSREAPHLSRRRQDGQASDAHLVIHGETYRIPLFLRCWILTGAFYVGNG